MKAGQIINKFGKKHTVPLRKARKMLARGEIDDFKTVEVTRILNASKPETQADFERRMQGQKPNKSQEENLALTRELIEAQKELARLRSANNDLKETIEAPKGEPKETIKEVKQEEIKIKETIEAPKPLRAKQPLQTKTK